MQSRFFVTFLQYFFLSFFVKCRCWQEHPLVILLLYFSCYMYFWSELSFCSFISMEIKIIFFSNIWLLLSLSVKKSILSFCGCILSLWAFVASFRWKLRHQVPSWMLKGASSSPLDAKLFYTEHDISKRYYDIIINYKHIVFKHDFPGNLRRATFAILAMFCAKWVRYWLLAVLWCKI